MSFPLIRYTSLGLCLVLGIGEASAWGPRARKAISVASLQAIREEFSDAFKAGETNYDADILRGAEAGLELIYQTVPINSYEQAVAAVSNQVQLLRDVRQHGAGSYFAFRMGALSALAANLVEPFGIAFTEEEKRLGTRIDADLDAMLEKFSVSPKGSDYVYLRNAGVYFSEKRTFYPDDLTILIDDYNRGRGPKGFLAQAGQAYFGRAVEASTDTWYTVLRNKGDITDVPPSPSIVAAYFVDEIRYLLDVRQNLREADRAYENFAKIDTIDKRTAHETIGDMYYAFGEQVGSTRALERGVREWQLAQGEPGPQRQRSAGKLAKHFISEGETWFRRAASPEATDTDLEEALRSFQRALEFDRANDIAADRINETTIAISERRENFETQTRFIENALAVSQQADTLRVNEDFGQAITTYNQSLSLLEAVDGTFRQLSDTAKAETNKIDKSIKEIVNQVLDRADKLIEDGEEHIRANRFQDAIQQFLAVESAVSVIPASAGGANAKRKEDVIARAAGKVTEADNAEKRYKADQEAAAKAAQPPAKKSPFN